MSITTGRLGLSIPRVGNVQPPSTVTNTRKLQRWIAGLPKAHLGETSRLIYNLLVDLNRQQMPLDKRFAALELVREPADYVCANLKQHYLGQPFPLPARLRRIVNLVNEFEAEVALGYKLIVESVAGAGGTSQLGLLAPALQRSLFHLSRVLLCTYQAYAPAPENLWYEVHTLYRYGTNQGLHNQPIHFGTSKDRTETTINQVYKRILLLALANPYQLAQEDIDRVDRLLAHWASLVDLWPLIDRKAPPGLFAVDLDEDEPPGYVAFRHDCGSSCLALDTANLANQLQSHLAALEAGDEPGEPYSPFGLGANVVRRVLLSCGVLTKRSYPRRGTRVRVTVTLGLTAITRHLQRDPSRRTGTTTGQSHATYDSAPVVHADGSGMYPEAWEFDAQKPTVRQPVAPAPVPPKHYFNVTNESAGGYCLLWKDRGDSTTKVGDLVMVHSGEKHTDDFSLCVVRWMKSVDEMMVMGTELLSPRADAVGTRAVGGGGQRSHEYMEGLLLPPLAPVDRPSTLLTQPLYQPGDIIELKIGSKRSRVVLLHNLEHTRAFKQFTYAETDGDGITPTDDGFDSLWSSL